MNILDYIPVGHKNAVGRAYLAAATGQSDRKVRLMIESACSRKHPILNMQDGKGYFQPSKEEMHLVKLYRAQENKRTRKIRNKVSELDSYVRAAQKAEKEQIAGQMSLFELHR